MESAKLRGLVVAPRGKAQRVQGNRNKDRIVAQKVGPGPRHPRTGRARDVRPVAMFQAEDQFAPDIGITHHGAPGLPRARDGVAFLADQPLAPGGLPRQRLAAEVAGGAEDEGRFGPAGPQSEKSSSTRAPQFRHSGGNTACRSVCILMSGP
jgi:hypothetical protein